MNTLAASAPGAAPLPDLTLHAIVDADMTLGLQLLEQPSRRQPLPSRSLGVRLEHGIEPAYERPQPWPGLDLTFVAELGARRADRFAHRLPPYPKLADNLPDRLRVNEEHTPNPANRLRCQHPGPAPPVATRASMIRSSGWVPIER
jgi:hypothetical protein